MSVKRRKQFKRLRMLKDELSLMQSRLKSATIKQEDRMLHLMREIAILDAELHPAATRLRQSTMRVIEGFNR